MKLTHCPSTLAAGYETYSPIALKNLFAGKKVSHILPYDSPEKNEEDNEKFIENIEHISRRFALLKKARYAYRKRESKVRIS